MSALGADHKYSILIQLFDIGRQLVQELHISFPHLECTLVLGEDVQFEDPAFSTGHLLGTTTRTCEGNWQKLINSSLDYLLIQFRDFVRLRSRLDLAHIKILIYEESRVTRIETLNANQITLFSYSCGIYSAENESRFILDRRF
jgi:hypothetical protein